MKKLLALATSVLALNASAVTISITHHDANQLTFNISNTDVLGYDRITQEAGDRPHVTLADVSVFARPGHVVDISIYWRMGPLGALEISDSFTSMPLLPAPVPEFEGDSFELIAPNTYEYTYIRPGGPIDLYYVPDGGSALGLFGCALLGIWGGKRVLA